MKINILEEKFVNISNILLVKTYVKKLGDYVILKDSLNGKLIVDLNYLDKNMDENFKNIELPFEILIKDSMKILDLSLNDLSLTVIDNKGLNITYNIDINYEENEDREFEKIKEEVIEIPVIVNDDKKEDKEEVVEKKEEAVEKTVIDENNLVKDSKINKCEELTKEEKINESIKDDISKDYDELLDNSLIRQEENVKILETSSENEDDFLKRYNMFEAKNMKIIIINNASNRKEEIISEYNLNEQSFESCYNNQNDSVVIKRYE